MICLFNHYQIYKDEFSPLSAEKINNINQMIPKVKACIEKKNPTHFLSPERMLELERINIQKQREFVSNRKAFLNFNPNIQTGEFNESVFRDPPKRNTNYRKSVYVFLVFKCYRRTYKSETRKYPSYLDEDKDFTYVSK